MRVTIIGFGSKHRDFESKSEFLGNLGLKSKKERSKYKSEGAFRLTTLLMEELGGTRIKFDRKTQK